MSTGTKVGLSAAVAVAGLVLASLDQSAVLQLVGFVVFALGAAALLLLAIGDLRRGGR